MFNNIIIFLNVSHFLLIRLHHCIILHNFSSFHVLKIWVPNDTNRVCLLILCWMFQGRAVMLPIFSYSPFTVSISSPTAKINLRGCILLQPGSGALCSIHFNRQGARTSSCTAERIDSIYDGNLYLAPLLFLMPALVICTLPRVDVIDPIRPIARS